MAVSGEARTFATGTGAAVSTAILAGRQRDQIIHLTLLIGEPRFKHSETLGRVGEAILVLKKKPPEL